MMYDAINQLKSKLEDDLPDANILFSYDTRSIDVTTDVIIVMKADSESHEPATINYADVRIHGYLILDVFAPDRDALESAIRTIRARVKNASSWGVLYAWLTSVDDLSDEMRKRYRAIIEVEYVGYEQP